MASASTPAAPAMEGRGPGPGPGPARAGRAGGGAGGARAGRAFLVAGGALLGLLLVSLLLVDPDFDPELPAAGRAGAGADAGEGAGAGVRGPGSDAGTEAATSVAFPGRRPEGTARTGARFRVHVLDGLPRGLVGGLLPGSGTGACESDYAGSEVVFPQLVAASDVYEPEIELADFVLVPLQTEYLLQKLLAAGRDLAEATTVVNKVFGGFMDRLEAESLRWAEAEGRDHIFTFPTERGVAVLDHGNRERIRKSIFLTGISVEPRQFFFDPWKDLVVPPLRRAPRPSWPAAVEPDRSTWVHFRGNLRDSSPQGVRHGLQKSLASEPGVIFAGPDATCGKECAFQEMLRSDFCLVLGEVEGWSLRLYDSIALGCIPVLVAGDVDLPFETGLDYSEFAVKIPPERSGELAAILRAIPEAAKRAKRQRLEIVKAAFSWPEPGDTSEGSAFSYLLQELQSKVRYMRHSGHKFWTHPIANG